MSDTPETPSEPQASSETASETAPIPTSPKPSTEPSPPTVAPDPDAEKAEGEDYKPGDPKQAYPEKPCPRNFRPCARRSSR